MKRCLKILSPLDSPDEVERLAGAGADEFYCGVLDEEWYTRYPIISINRRPAGKGHFKKFCDLKDAVDRAHRLRISVYVALNEHYYSAAQYPLILKYIEHIIDAGADALIISDYGLMVYVHENFGGIPVHVSTGGAVFNWKAAEFYCEEFGVTNITLPRHLTVGEIAGIVSRGPRVATTVFVLNSRCVNVDGYCTFQHGLAGREVLPMFRNACMLPFNVTVWQDGQTEPVQGPRGTACVVARQKIWEQVHVDDHPCGACALYEFNDIGIDSLKIVGRGNATERKLKDIRFLRTLIDFLAAAHPSQADFRQCAQTLYRETYARPCRRHLCYYPSA